MAAVAKLITCNSDAMGNRDGEKLVKWMDLVGAGQCLARHMIMTSDLFEDSRSKSNIKVRNILR